MVTSRDRKYGIFFSTAASFPRSRASKLFSPDLGFAASLLSDNLAPVVRKVDSSIHRINHYPVDSAIGFPNTYPLDRDLYGG